MTPRLSTSSTISKDTDAVGKLLSFSPPLFSSLPFLSSCSLSPFLSVAHATFRLFLPFRPSPAHRTPLFVSTPTSNVYLRLPSPLTRLGFNRCPFCQCWCPGLKRRSYLIIGENFVESNTAVSLCCCCCTKDIICKSYFDQAPYNEGCCDKVLAPHRSHLTPHTSHTTHHTSHPTSSYRSAGLALVALLSSPRRTSTTAATVSLHSAGNWTLLTLLTRLILLTIQTLLTRLTLLSLLPY